MSLSGPSVDARQVWKRLELDISFKYHQHIDGI